MFMVRALKKNAAQLTNISRERIHDEVNKMLLTDYPSKSMRLLKVLGLMPYVFVDLTNKPKEEYAILSLLPKDLPLRLAGLFVDTKTGDGDSIIAEKDLRTTKYSVDIIKIVSTILNNFRYFFDKNVSKDEFIRMLLNSLGVKNFNVVLQFAEGYAHYKGMDINAEELTLKAKEQAQLMAQHPLPITGQDLIDMGLEPSPKFRELLNKVKNLYIKDPTITKDRYLSVIRNNV